MHIADLLSRSYLPDASECDSFDHVYAVDYIPVRSERLSKMRKATQDNDVLQMLITVVQEGWPDDKTLLPPQVMLYFHCHDEIAVNDGLVLKGSHVIVPESMWKEITEALHTAHIRVESTLRRARECVYWPSMNSDIKMISQCEICNKHNTSQQRESLMTHDPSESVWPFQKIGVDLMSIRNRDFLVTVDYNSNFGEVDQLTTTRCSVVIRKLKAHFGRYGSPSVVVSDINGPQFYCEEFNLFMKKWDVEHRTSSPGDPVQWNG